MKETKCSQWTFLNDGIMTGFIFTFIYWLSNFVH